MAEARHPHAPQPDGATGVIVFADGRVIWGGGFGAEGEAVGELCFHTAMTGYQEIMTDPSFAKQVIAFTFPHIGNVGANDEDVEAAEAHALGCLVREVVTEPSNYRSSMGFDAWLKHKGRIGICGVDTRSLTQLVRREGPPNIAIAHNASASSILSGCSAWRRNGRAGGDGPRQGGFALQVERWTGGKWHWGQGYEVGAGERPSTSLGTNGSSLDFPPHRSCRAKSRRVRANAPTWLQSITATNTISSACLLRLVRM
jgi:carbamoyl-phosphate synthase small subunit